MDPHALLERLRARDMTAIGRAISLVENGAPGFERLLAALHPALGRAHRIGVTGPPGAGKSTLVRALVRRWRSEGVTAAVVAVDPTSAQSGGALLGDRIRMEPVALDPGVYIRSMATRGALGGLALATREVCDVLDAAGYDRIVVETVGVGQSELDIAAAADTTVLVLVPESGDGIQTLKSGVMDVADLFVVNKADRPHADRLAHEIALALRIRRGIAYGPDDAGAGERWRPPVLPTVATDDTGVRDLAGAIAAHRRWLEEAGRLATRRRERLVRHTRAVVERALHRWVEESGIASGTLAGGLPDVEAGRRTPYDLAAEALRRLPRP